jgi:hypothetical protein
MSDELNGSKQALVDSWSKNNEKEHHRMSTDKLKLFSMIFVIVIVVVVFLAACTIARIYMPR